MDHTTCILLTLDNSTAANTTAGTMAHKMLLARYNNRNKAPETQRAPTNETAAERSAANEFEALLDPEPDIEVLPVAEKRVKRFRTEGKDYKVKVKMPAAMPKDLMRFFGRTFEKITAQVLDNIPDHDMVGLVFSWDSLDHPVWYPFGLKKDFSVEKFLQKIDGILQSNANLSLDHPISISVTRVEMPQGEGGRRKGISNRTVPDLRKWFKQKGCIISIDNEDQLCLGRALTVAIGRIKWLQDNMTQTKYKYLCDRRRSKQKKEAIKLHAKAKVTQGPCGIPEVMKFQSYLKNYRITVRSVDAAGGIIYEGPLAPHDIELLYQNGHFDVITCLPALFGRNYYCKECKKPYNDPAKHRCTNSCKCCRKANCPIGEWTFCCDCHRWMKSPRCLENHKKLGRSFTVVDRVTKEKVTYPPMSVCQKFQICVECSLPIEFTKDHTCGEKMCSLCKCSRPIEHLCYIPVIQKESLIKPSEKGREKKVIMRRKMVSDCIENDDDSNSLNGFINDDPTDSDPLARFSSDDDDDEDKGPMEQMGSNPPVLEEMQDHEASVDSDYDEVVVKAPALEDAYSFIWYDLETTQTTPIEGKEQWFAHKVNFVCAKTTCNGCSRAFERAADCPDCQKVIFRGDESMKDFVDWLLPQDGAIAVAHNSSGFDGILMVREITSRGYAIKNAILRGQKIMSCKVPGKKYGVKLIDSMNFIMSALSAFPKMFDLHELKKGYFPHYFNTDQNANYSGRMPDTHYYAPDSMKPDARKRFLEWYGLHKNDHFDMRKELSEYCESDVDILCQGMTKFRKVFYDLTEVDCLRKCATIASAAMRTFQQNYLEKDQLGVIPRNGYTHYSRQSRIGLLWLKWWSHTHGDARIQHDANGKEYKIGNYLVDGYHKDTDTVLEFLGCHFHSCPKCTDHTMINPTTKKLRKDEYEHTLKRLGIIEDLGYNMEIIWECQFKKEMEENVELQAFLQAQSLSTPLSPVDALFGGRTNALRLYYDCEDGEEIKVLDFTSLYPFCNSRCEYGIGHPEVTTENFKPLDEYFGFIKCRVLPPQDLFVPVLPYRSNGKLTFPLCKTCAEEMGDCCRHTREERAWDGTFVSSELRKAMETGYRVLRIYEVWHWKETAEYDPGTKMGGIFTEYMKTFMKIKQEASGWPSGCETEEDKLEYIREYERVEGIKLEYDLIKKNPGMRSVAKLLLNSLWGKFAQNPDLAKTEYVNSYKDLVKLLLDDDVEVRNLFLVNDDVMMIQYKPKECQPLCTENIGVAAFTTAHARLRLYGVMEEIVKDDDARLLYTDTDSVFYVKRRGMPDPVCGPFLGDLTDEYPDKRIVQFCSGGPKNYMYRFADGSHVTKVKGFTLNYENSQIITPELVEEMVRTADGRKVLIRNERKIARSREHGIVTKPEHKNYRVVYTKRVLKDGGMTLPYGYKESRKRPASAL